MSAKIPEREGVVCLESTAADSGAGTARQGPARRGRLWCRRLLSLRRRDTRADPTG